MFMKINQRWVPHGAEEGGIIQFFISVRRQQTFQGKAVHKQV